MGKERTKAETIYFVVSVTSRSYGIGPGNLYTPNIANMLLALLMYVRGNYAVNNLKSEPRGLCGHYRGCKKGRGSYATADWAFLNSMS